MNVIVNGRFLGRQITGVERYGRELLSRLDHGLQIVRPERWSGGVRGHLWEQVALPGLVGANQLLWSPANTGPLLVKHQVLTLHDLSPLEHPEWYQPVFANWYRLFVPRLIRQVQKIVVSSEFARAKLLERDPALAGQIAVIPGGVDTARFHPGAQTDLTLPDRYLLFVGSLQPRKNLARLLIAWQEIQRTVSDTWLVIAGSESKVFNSIALPASERVIFLGTVSEENLAGLYASAALFVLPSLDEGFGLPVLEAMACGVPVAASKAGALPEVVGEAGLLFDPLDIHDMTDTVIHGLTDTSLQAFFQAQGLQRAREFNWQSSADKIWKVFQTCIQS